MTATTHATAATSVRRKSERNSSTACRAPVHSADDSRGPATIMRTTYVTNEMPKLMNQAYEYSWLQNGEMLAFQLSDTAARKPGTQGAMPSARATSARRLKPPEYQ